MRSDRTDRGTRNSLRQVAQVRVVDLAAFKQKRLQYFCWLLGGAPNTSPQWRHVSWFRAAVRCLRPLSKADRPAHARHRCAGLSALTSSCLPHVRQMRVRIALALALTGAALFGGCGSGSPQSGGLRTPAASVDSTRDPAATRRVRGQRFVLLWFSADRGWISAWVASQKTSPVASDIARLARPYTFRAGKNPMFV